MIRPIISTAATVVLIVLVGAMLQGVNVYGVEFSADAVFSGENSRSSSTIYGAAVDNGMHVGVVVSNPLGESEAKSAKDSGVAWIRADIGIADSVKQTSSVAQTSGLSIIGVVSYWVVDQPDSFTLQDWGNAIQAVQSAYPEIHVWEIWNEPTSSKYQHGYMDGTPQRYLDLMKSAYTVLKARDATATVLGIGGAQLGKERDLSFTAAVFSLGGGAYMDGLAIHAYPYELNVGKTWDYYEQLWLEELNQYTQFGKPLWITETGLRSDQTNESEQASYLERSYSFFNASGVRAYIWYEMVDDGAPGDFSVGPWGLLRNDLTLKQAYYSYRSLISKPSLDLNVTPLSPSDGTAATGEAVLVKVQVNSDGPIQGATVTIYVNASAACSGLSDANGYYSCSFSSKLSGLTYRWYATASKQGYNAGTSQVWSFTLIAAFDFSLSNSGNIKLNQGGSGLETITGTLVSGSPQSVSLSCTIGLPPTAMCFFNPQSGNPPFSSSLTVSTSSSTPPGSYNITVTGTSAGLSSSTTFTLTVPNGTTTATTSLSGNQTASTTSTRSTTNTTGTLSTVSSTTSVSITAPHTYSSNGGSQPTMNTTVSLATTTGSAGLVPAVSDQATTSVSVAASPSSPFVGSLVSFTVTLHGSWHGLVGSVSGKPVAVFAWNSNGQCTTGQDGTCQVTLTTPSILGTYPVTAQFQGDGDFQASSGSMTLNVVGATSATTTISRTSTTATFTSMTSTSTSSSRKSTSYVYSRSSSTTTSSRTTSSSNIVGRRLNALYPGPFEGLSPGWLYLLLLVGGWSSFRLTFSPGVLPRLRQRRT